MISCHNWLTVRDKLAAILYSQLPLTERWKCLRAELQVLGWDAYGARIELESMAWSAADNREAPFLDVGKDLLTFCDQQLYRELEIQGQDPRWILELRRRREEGKNGSQRDRLALQLATLSM